MSWELWSDRGGNLIEDFDTLSDALAFAWGEIAAGGEAQVRGWSLLDGERVRQARPWLRPRAARDHGARRDQRGRCTDGPAARIRSATPGDRASAWRHSCRAAMIRAQARHEELDSPLQKLRSAILQL